MSVIKMPPHKTVQKVIILKSDEWSHASKFGNFFMITQFPLNNGQSRSKIVPQWPEPLTFASGYFPISCPRDFFMKPRGKNIMCHNHHVTTAHG
jgi:hypothetical protein